MNIQYQPVWQDAMVTTVHLCSIITEIYLN